MVNDCGCRTGVNVGFKSMTATEAATRWGEAYESPAKSNALIICIGICCLLIVVLLGLARLIEVVIHNNMGGRQE